MTAEGFSLGCQDGLIPVPRQLLDVLPNQSSLPTNKMPAGVVRKTFWCTHASHDDELRGRHAGAKVVRLVKVTNGDWPCIQRSAYATETVSVHPASKNWRIPVHLAFGFALESSQMFYPARDPSRSCPAKPTSGVSSGPLSLLPPACTMAGSPSSADSRQ